MTPDLLRCLLIQQYAIIHAPTYLSLGYRYKTRRRIEASLIVSISGDVFSSLSIRRVRRILGSKKWEWKRASEQYDRGRATMRRLAIRPNYVQPSLEHYYS